MSLLVPRGWNQPLDSGETLSECRLAVLLGLLEAGSELVEVVDSRLQWSKVLQNVVSIM